MTPQSFYTRFQKALHDVKLLDCCYEKELDDTKAKIIFFNSFPREHIQDYVHHSQCDFDNEPLKDFKSFFQGHFDANTLKKNDQPNNCQYDKGKASSHNHVSFTTMMKLVHHLKQTLLFLTVPWTLQLILPWSMP